LAVTNSFNSVAVLLGKGDGTFTKHVDYIVAGDIQEAIGIGDVNADGKLDLVVGHHDSSGQDVSVLWGNGDGTFQPHVDYAGGGFSINLADFNQDGALDIATRGVMFSMLLNTGGTVFKTTSSPNPSKQGQAVTFIASVSASLKAQPVPTGTVRFKDGTTTLATLNLQQGRARFRTSTLSVGTHQITAFYSGDSHFNPNTALTITQVVTQ
jgi:hypothetical protein